MKIGKRVRVNARLPDHDGKFRDEITQEFTIELDTDTYTLDATIEKINERVDADLKMIFERIEKLGGRNYTEEK